MTFFSEFMDHLKKHWKILSNAVKERVFSVISEILVTPKSHLLLIRRTKSEDMKGILMNLILSGGIEILSPTLQPTSSQPTSTGNDLSFARCGDGK